MSLDSAPNGSLTPNGKIRRQRFEPGVLVVGDGYRDTNCLLAVSYSYAIVHFLLTISIRNAYENVKGILAGLGKVNLSDLL